MYRPRLSLLAVALTAALVPVGISSAQTLAKPAPSSTVVAENAAPFSPLTPAALAAEPNAAGVLASREYVRRQAGLARTALARKEAAQQAAQRAARRAALNRARLERLRVEQLRRQQVLLERVRALATARRASRSRALAPAPAGNPRSIAQQMLTARGQADQFGCLDNLWSKESGWSVYAANPSGAYGIPQSLPGSKMASAGADWRTNAATQIRWGLGYIAASYGSPCGAWSHSQSYNWY